MHDSITIAEVGSMVKVSGSRIATPFGPPSPGSTPTKMPSTRPSIIRASLFQVSSTWKPWKSRSKASILSLPKPSEAERGLERPFRHDDVERDLEGDEHRDREHESGEQRGPG